MAVGNIEYNNFLSDAWVNAQLNNAQNKNFFLKSLVTNTYTDPTPLPSPRVAQRVLKQNTDNKSSKSNKSTSTPVETPVEVNTTVETPVVAVDKVSTKTPTAKTSTTPAVTVTPVITTSTPTGAHVFKHKGMNVGHMQALLDEAAKYGIYFRVTSGVRPGAKTKQGRTSNHSLGKAIDVTPIEGQTYADLTQKIKNSPEFVAWMQNNGYGIYDETTPEVMARTGASGAHWHIGPDRVAIAGLQKIIA